MNNNNSTNRTCILAFIFVIILIIIARIDKDITNNKSVVDTDVQIIKANDSLKLKVNNLDSIKDAKVIEVQKLDNDSTIKLFYKLIK